MFAIKLLKSIVNILQSEISPNQIAAGAVIGALIGLTPVSALHIYFLFFLMLILNVNIGSAMLSAMVFKLIGMLIDPISDKIGYYLLVSNTSLKDFWTNLYNTPIVPFTHFNNTVVLGSFVVGILLALPIFFLSKKLLVIYRIRLKDKVAKWKIMKVFKITSIYNVYDKLNK
ncbi:MAG: TIGR03546 family protein [Endomicrobiales bacterium]|nr:TIGR03546 family protein [Endomicrobiales bacterium]